MAGGIGRLREFVRAASASMGPDGLDEMAAHKVIAPLLRDLVAQDDWLPATFAQPHPQYYQQYLLHCDPAERFSVVSFVWGPGQSTPVHDHTVWGIIGILRGAERCRFFERRADGQLAPQAETILETGAVSALGPKTGDVHRVANAYDDRVSVAIHVYGGNIGAIARHVYDTQTGIAKDFVSGYAAAIVPNLWDRSAETRARLG
ncbi:MAG: cysteine dioxygenase [Alphaproteobacteria bacterium]|nr:cysteine dioxygenase [Alphaproteobacteria bacterium]